MNMTLILNRKLFRVETVPETQNAETRNAKAAMRAGMRCFRPRYRFIRETVLTLSRPA
jgi:hypothetical protein